MYHVIVMLVVAGLIGAGCGDNAEPRAAGTGAPTVVTAPTTAPTVAPEAPAATMPDPTAPTDDPTVADDAALQTQLAAEQAKAKAAEEELAKLKALQAAKKKAEAEKTKTEQETPSPDTTETTTPEPEAEEPPVLSATTIAAIVAGAHVTMVNPETMELWKQSQEKKKQQQLEWLKKEAEALKAMQEANAKLQGGTLVSGATEHAIPYFGNPQGESGLQSIGCPTDYVTRALQFHAWAEIDGIKQPLCVKLTETAAAMPGNFGQEAYVGGSGGQSVIADCGVGGVVVGWQLRKQQVAVDVCEDTGNGMVCGFTGLRYVEVRCRAIQPLAYGLGSDTWTVQPTYTSKSGDALTSKVAFAEKKNKGNYSDSGVQQCPADQVLAGFSAVAKYAGQAGGRLIGLAGHCASFKTEAFTKPNFSVATAVSFGNGIGVPYLYGGLTSEATFEEQQFITKIHSDVPATEEYDFNLGADWILGDAGTTMVLCPHKTVLVKGTNQEWSCRTWNPSGASGVEKVAELWVAGKLVDEIAYADTFPKLAKSQTSETEAVACPSGQYATGITLETPESGGCYNAWGGCGSSQPNAVRRIASLTCSADAVSASTAAETLTCGANEHLVGLIRFVDKIDSQGKHVTNGGTASTNYLALCRAHTTK